MPYFPNVLFFRRLGLFPVGNGNPLFRLYLVLHRWRDSRNKNSQMWLLQVLDSHIYCFNLKPLIEVRTRNRFLSIQIQSFWNCVDLLVIILSLFACAFRKGSRILKSFSIYSSRKKSLVKILENRKKTPTAFTGNWKSTVCWKFYTINIQSSPISSFCPIGKLRFETSWVRLFL